MSKAENRLLCFRLAEELYAAPLSEVKEVLGVPEITPIPQVPAYFLGIMNLRGQVISVIDLRAKFGLKAGRHSETCVIIFEYPAFSVGVVVDEVKSVLTIEPGELCPAPESKHTKKAEFITGVVSRGDDMVLTLDIVRALDLKEEAMVKAITQNAA